MSHSLASWFRCKHCRPVEQLPIDIKCIPTCSDLILPRINPRVKFTYKLHLLIKVDAAVHPENRKSPQVGLKCGWAECIVSCKRTLHHTFFIERFGHDGHHGKSASM